MPDDVSPQARGHALSGSGGGKPEVTQTEARIDAETCVPEREGEAMNLNMAIDGLLAADGVLEIADPADRC